MFEVFAEAENHVAGVDALAALAIDQCLDIYIGRVGLPHNNARALRARRIEILWEGEIERTTRKPPWRTDAPIGEYRDAPHVICQLRGRQVDAALAEHDRNLALVVQTVAPLGVDELAIGTADLARELPEAPEAGSADFLVSIALIGSAAPFHGHRRSVVSEVSAGASDAGIIRPRGVQPHIRGRVNERFAPWPEFIPRLSEEVVECFLRVFERARAALDQPREVGRQQHLGHFQWAGLACTLEQIFGARVRKVDDTAVMQRAGSLIGAKYDNFHRALSFGFAVWEKRHEGFDGGQLL